MTYNIEDLIDRYFDGQLSPAAHTHLMSQVAGDPTAKQLFDTEQFIRGAFTHDVSAVPQAAAEPSASLMAKLSATKPLAQQAAQQVAQEVTRETVTQSASTVAMKGTSSVAGKVAVGGLATAGKTIMGLSVGAFQFVAGAAITVAVATGILISSNNSTPEQQQVIAPIVDSTNMLTIENKIDTPIAVTTTPVTPVEKESRISNEVKSVSSDRPAVYTPADPLEELKNQKPRMQSSDTATTRLNTRNTEH
jgi:hypothetical protein